MFTGIIQAVGSVAEILPQGGDLRLAIDAAALASSVEATRLKPGESIAVSGVCLTIAAWRDGRFAADVSRETLAVTTLGSLRRGDRVNLEAALRVGDPLGGHLVSGHVDAVAQVIAVEPDARSTRVQVEAPVELARFIAPKGSIALDGISLTVNEVQGRTFGVNLIPHTLQVTAFRDLAAGRRVNLEVDMLARYVHRALQE